ncbi:MAG: hypothetical protein ACWGQW_01165 [bacterium]
MTLRTAIQALQDHAITAGAKDAPDDATESALAFPFSICYPASGRIVARPGASEKGLHTIILDLHVNRVDLPTDIQLALTWFEAFKALLIADPTLNGTVNVIEMNEETPISYAFGQMNYAGTTTVGWRFNITVKQFT